jgi:hypothetical protein
MSTRDNASAGYSNPRMYNRYRGRMTPSS